MTSAPPGLCPDLSLGEIKARVQHATKAKAEIDRFKATTDRADLKLFVFNTMHLALFIYTEEIILARLCDLPSERLVENLRFVEPLLKLFLGERLLTDFPAGELCSNEYDLDRDRQECLAAYKRDGRRCVVTQSPGPDVAHLWPLSMNNDADRLLNAYYIFQDARDLLLDSKSEILLIGHLLTPNPWGGNLEIACHDKTWNMICLNEHLHRHWSQAHCGLKPTSLSTNGTSWIDEDGEPDSEHVKLAVEWRWLSSPVATAFTEMHLESDPHTLASLIHQGTGYSCPEAQANTIKTGRMIELKVNKDDLERTKLMIKTQWMLVQVAAFSGAAKVYDDLDGKALPPLTIQYPDDIESLEDKD